MYVCIYIYISNYEVAIAIVVALRYASQLVTLASTASTYAACAAAYLQQFTFGRTRTWNWRIAGQPWERNKVMFAAWRSRSLFRLRACASPEPQACQCSRWASAGQASLPIRGLTAASSCALAAAAGASSRALRALAHATSCYVSALLWQNEKRVRPRRPAHGRRRQTNQGHRAKPAAAHSRERVATSFRDIAPAAQHPSERQAHGQSRNGRVSRNKASSPMGRC